MDYRRDPVGFPDMRQYHGFNGPPPPPPSHTFPNPSYANYGFNGYGQPQIPSYSQPMYVQSEEPHPSAPPMELSGVPVRPPLSPPPPPPPLRRMSVPQVQNPESEKSVTVSPVLQVVDKDKDTVGLDLNNNEDELVFEEDWESYEEDDDEDEDDEEEVDEDENEEEKSLRKYRNKISRLREMLKLPVQESKEKVYNPKSDTVPVKITPVLPASSEGTSNLFDQFVNDVNGKSTQKKKRQVPKEMGTFPTNYLPKSKFYEVEDCPWKDTVPDSDPLLYNSSLYKSHDHPNFNMSILRLFDWEESNRKSLNVASYVDHFMWGVQKHLKVMKRKLGSRRYEEDPTLAFEQIEDLYWQVSESLGFLDSAARGLNDLIKMAVSRIGNQMLVRRDNWFSQFTSSPGRSVYLSLRGAGLNEDGLFGSELMEKAIKSMKEDKHDDVQDAFLTGGAPSGSGFQGRGRARGRGRPFRGRGRGSVNRGYSRGGPRGRGRGNGLWNYNARSSQPPKRTFQNRRGDFRGSRGRGFPRGRGFGRGGQTGQGGQA